MWQALGTWPGQPWKVSNAVEASWLRPGGLDFYVRSQEAVKLLQEFYRSGNPNAPDAKRHRPLEENRACNTRDAFGVVGSKVSALRVELWAVAMGASSSKVQPRVTMWVVRIADFLKMSAPWLSHEQCLAAGILHHHEDGFFCIFVSHQWRLGVIKWRFEA